MTNKEKDANYDISVAEKEQIVDNVRAMTLMSTAEWDSIYINIREFLLEDSHEEQAD
jgi:hypothetical protein